MAPNVLYARIEKADPRPMVVHAVRIDTSAEGIGFHVSPRRREWIAGDQETDRQTTRDFMRTARAADVPLVVAINGDAFSPWPAPFNQSTPTDLRGLAVADGQLVSLASGTPSLLIARAPAGSDAPGGDGKVSPRPLENQSGGWELNIEVTSAETDLSSAVAAISGFALCLADGQAVAGKDDLHPRTGIGLSHDRRWLFLVVIDGRQPASRGATVEELGNWLRVFGAWRGINLDGGGSSTLAWWNDALPANRACQLLNLPVGSGGNFAKWPAKFFLPTERANGNNLGIGWRSR